MFKKPAGKFRPRIVGRQFGDDLADGLQFSITIRDGLEIAFSSNRHRLQPSPLRTQPPRDNLLVSAGECGYFTSVNYERLITIEPGKRSGKPCIRGLRITVYDVLEYLASGMTEDEVLEDFPELTRQDIKACLAFAADREKKLFTVHT